MSNRIRIVSSSTSASDTLMSPATTSPLSRTRSSTSTSPVDRPCPSVSDVGIGPLFYEVSRALAYLTVKARDGTISAMAMPDPAGLCLAIQYGTNIVCIEARQGTAPERTRFLQLQELAGRIDHAVVECQFVHRHAVEAEAVSRKADAGRRRTCRLPVDRGVADHQRRPGVRVRARRQMTQRRRIGLARKRAVAAEHGVVRKIAREIEAVEDASRRRDRLVGQHRERRPASERVEDGGDAVVRPRVVQKKRVVDRQIPIQRVGGALHAAPLEPTPPPPRRALTPPAANLFFREPPP